MRANHHCALRTSCQWRKQCLGGVTVTVQLKQRHHRFRLSSTTSYNHNSVCRMCLVHALLCVAWLHGCGQAMRSDNGHETQTSVAMKPFKDTVCGCHVPVTPEALRHSSRVSTIPAVLASQCDLRTCEALDNNCHASRVQHSRDRAHVATSLTQCVRDVASTCAGGTTRRTPRSQCMRTWTCHATALQ